MKIYISALVTLLLFSAQAGAQDVQYDIKVDGITCPFCVATSEKALKKIDGVHAVGADLKEGIISVCGAARLEFSEPQLKKLFRKKGFTYRSFTKANACTIKDGENITEDGTHDHKHGE